MSIFEQASRAKLRFDTPKGLLSAEDLWDLPLTSASKANLDDIAKDLHRQLQATTTVSFVNKEHGADTKVQLAFDVVKHVIDVRLAEKVAAETLAANREKKQRLLAIIESKEGEALGAKSVEELRAMAAAL